MNAQLEKSAFIVAEIAKLVEYARAFGDEDLYHGKRAWPRFNAALQLEATKDPQEPSVVWTVAMHNVSIGGFAAWSKTELERHDTVYVRQFSASGQRPWLKAVVRHCTRGLRGYLVGAEFLNEAISTDSEEPHDEPQAAEIDPHDADFDPRDRIKARLVEGVRRCREHRFHI